MERLTKIFKNLEPLDLPEWLMIITIFFCIFGACIYAEAAIPPKQIEPEFNITTTTILVHWFDSEKELQERTGYDDIAGISECEWRPDFNISFCEFWLVTPKSLDDEYNFDTIGHEFYHALAGAFHNED